MPSCLSAWRTRIRAREIRSVQHPPNFEPCLQKKVIRGSRVGARDSAKKQLMVDAKKSAATLCLVLFWFLDSVKRPVVVKP
jgi:hypothetical protein